MDFNMPTNTAIIALIILIVLVLLGYVTFRYFAYIKADRGFRAGVGADVSVLDLQKQ